MTKQEKERLKDYLAELADAAQRIDFLVQDMDVWYLLNTSEEENEK